MVIEATEQTLKTAAGYFSGMDDTVITSCLAGVMGRVFMTEGAAAAYLGDLALYGGTPSEELLRFKPRPDSSFVIMVLQSPAWEPLLERIYGDRAKRITRYALRKDPVFDRAKLEDIKERLPEGFTLEPLGQDTYAQCQENDWCRDWVSQFPTYDDYRRLGLGMVVKKNGLPVSGASSYYVYPGGIEIQIDTHPQYRRRGLAAAAAAGLILECLDRGLRPSWDAANLGSAALAEKLGYTFSHTYTAFEVNC